MQVQRCEIHLVTVQVFSQQHCFWDTFPQGHFSCFDNTISNSKGKIKLSFHQEVCGFVAGAVNENGKKAVGLGPVYMEWATPV